MGLPKKCTMLHPIKILRIAPCRSTPTRSYRETAAIAGTHELTKSKRLCPNPRIVLYRTKKFPSQPYCETAENLVPTGLQNKHAMLPPLHSIMLLHYKYPITYLRPYHNGTSEEVHYAPPYKNITHSTMPFHTNPILS